MSGKESQRTRDGKECLMDPHQTIDTDLWFIQAETKLRVAIMVSLAKGDWQAAYEDVLIGKAVFGRREP